MHPGHRLPARRSLVTMAIGWLVVGGLGACSPTLDWRQVKPPGWGIAVSLPCRPASQARSVDLAGTRVEMTVMACSEGGHTYALASADMGDPGKVAAALGVLTASAQANVQGVLVASAPASVPGMTPHDGARFLSLQGQLPDGQAVREQALVFARGLRVFQVTVIGPRVDSVLARPLFESIEVQP